MRAVLMPVLFVVLCAGCSGDSDPLGHYKGPAIDAIHDKMREVAEERFGMTKFIGLSDRDSDADNLIMNNHNKGYSIEGHVWPYTENTEESNGSIWYRISTGDNHEILNLVIRHNDEDPEILIGEKSWDEMKRLTQK